MPAVRSRTAESRATCSILTRWSRRHRLHDGQAASTSGYHRIVSGGRFGAAVAGAAIVCLTAGCDPAPVPRDPDQISMQLTVRERGDGDVRLGFGRQPSESQLVEIGQELTTSAFVDAPVTPTIDSNDGGYPFLVIKSAKIFEPGAHPQVRIDTTALCRGLFAEGYTQISFSVTEPQTPHVWALTPTPSDAGTSAIDNCDSAPRGTLTMSPQPWRWWAIMALVGACLAANLVALRLRRSSRNRHYESVAWGLLACVSFGVALFTSPSGQVDNVIVRWHISAGVSRVLTTLPLLILPLGVWALAQVGIELGNSASPTGPPSASGRIIETP